MTLFQNVSETNDLVSATLDELRRAYLSREPGKRLLLPTIQRSLVWDNKRIVDYWDTLYRGWFPGLMMVRPFNNTGAEAYSSGEMSSRVETAVDGDYELFDGQQRMAAILLGFGEGPLRRTHRLWFGFPKDGSGAKPARFRVSTNGQPFGYQVSDPNAKLDSETRRRSLDEWIGEYSENAERSTPKERADHYRGAFDKVTGDKLAGGGDWNWLPLSNLLTGVAQDEKMSSPEELALREIANRKIAVKTLFDAFSEEDYEEFFRRTGQGGVALTQDELAYSMIKKRFPETRPAFEGVVAEPSKIGMLASPTDLALGTLRIIRIQTSSPTQEEWERVKRPEPNWVRKLPIADVNAGGAEIGERSAASTGAASAYIELLEANHGGKRPITLVLETVRDMLTGSRDQDPHTNNNIPNMLLAHLPKELIDVAMMLTMLAPLKSIPDRTKRAFCLWTLLFADVGHVAWQLAAEASRTPEVDGTKLLRTVIAKLESWNNSAALHVPGVTYLEKLQQRSPADGLLKWEERFGTEGDDDPQSVTFLNDLNFWSRRGKNTLLFLQRAYIEDTFPRYDPTSGRDEDLPIDLDHIVAQGRFNYRWSPNKKRLPQGLDGRQETNFKDERINLVNQLGNLRWLCASENRKKGNRSAVTLGDLDRTNDEEKREFERLGQKLTGDWLSGWEVDDLYAFQQIVLRRTVRLASGLIEESGIRELTDFDRTNAASW